MEAVKEIKFGTRLAMGSR